MLDLFLGVTRSARATSSPWSTLLRVSGSLKIRSEISGQILSPVMRLHVGSGPINLAGWTNVDILPYQGVDIVFDIRQRWPFANVEFIFAEHFIEHLTLAEGLTFFRSARMALAADGVLRLSTPNLDWVWLTHYKNPEQMTHEEQFRGCLEINRAFHGWGHKFLYNRRMLELALRDCGFRTIVHCEYGISPTPELRGLERHEQQTGLVNHPAVLIVEASGIGSVEETLARQAEQFIKDFSAR